MASLPDIKTFRNAALGLGALAMATTATLGVTSQQAHADDARPVATAAAVTETRAIDRVNLPFADITDREPGLAELLAVRGSADAMIVKIHTNDPETIEEIDTILRRMVLAGYPRLALIAAQGRNGFDDSAEIYVLAAEGRPVATHTNITAYNADTSIMDSIRETYPNLWRAEQVSVLRSDSPASSLE